MSTVESKSDAQAQCIPWVEKYRPRTLEQIADQDHVVRTLRQTVTRGDLPHLLLHGPPGTGKTSTIFAVIREMYGGVSRSHILEMNASNERGIDTVRTKVKNFAQVSPDQGNGPVGYKIIILDEADAMTHEAQSALRRIMEKYTSVTRFCIICNYVSKIIDPIASRCVKFRFQPISSSAMAAHLSFIAASEHLVCAPDAIPHLVKVSGGDLRRSITFMQAAVALLDLSQPLTAEIVTEVAGAVPQHVTQALLNICFRRDYNALQTEVENVVLDAYPVNKLLLQLQQLVIEHGMLSDVQKAHVCIRIAEADKKLLDGADEYLQLMDVLMFLISKLN